MFFVTCLSFIYAGPVEYADEVESDFKSRMSVDLTKKLTRRFSVSLNEELRLKNISKEFDRINSELSLSYKAFRWWKINLGYTYIVIDHDGKKKTNYTDYWDFRHRVDFSNTFSYKTLTNWEFSLREMIRTTFLTEEGLDKREKVNPEIILKSRFMVEYKFMSKPISPFVYIELYNTLNKPEMLSENYVSRIRSSLGLKYRLNKRNSLEFSYFYDYSLEKDVNVKNSTGNLKSIISEIDHNHIVEIIYKLKF